MFRKVQPFVLGALALVWLLLRIPFFSHHYSFEWDSSQFARAVAEFNIFKHQPHPSGYYLWVLATGDLAPFAGGPMRAQIVLAFLMALAALVVFYALARQRLGRSAAFACTILLAYSPAVGLHSSIPLTTITDLLSSCIAGYLAFLDPRTRRWRIVVCFAALGLTAGFRQSGVGLLVPFIAGAALAHWRIAWRHVCGGALLGAALFLAWYLPLAETVGGWRNLSGMSSDLFRVSAQSTSIFYGAPLRRHLGMIEENVLYFAMNLCGWAVAYGLIWLRDRRAATGTTELLRGWWLYALWLIPNLVMVLGLHGAKVGYCLLCFPPLLLLLAWRANRLWMPAIAAGVLIALAISYFPYGSLLSPRRYTVDYLLYRSTPRLALDLEQSQARLDDVLQQLQRAGAPQPFVCARGLPEAPNIRTVTYDFPYVRWVTPESAPASRAIWLFDWRGPQDGTGRKIAGDELITVWEK